MNLKTILKTSILALTLVLTSQANAGLILSDDGAFAYDDVTDKTWYIDNSNDLLSWQDSKDWALALTVTFDGIDFIKWSLPNKSLFNGLINRGDIDTLLTTRVKDAGDTSLQTFWTSTSDTSNANKAYMFTDTLNIWSRAKTSTRDAWAVHSGQIGSYSVIPEPSSIALFLLAFSGLLVRRKMTK
ncbi:MAG: PEP-CTERM sorting domain-containing protein [Colwellia sp.]|nr:PEP-CTERM sorting domain-containing protein [Colwellia sp.]MCW9082280.1 PEP-CTERM sorting domain-containing protein [Colwellia sp.]